MDIRRSMRAATDRPHETAALRAKLVGPPSTGWIDLTSENGLAYASIFGRKAVTKDEQYEQLQMNVEGFLAAARDEQILLMPKIIYQLTRLKQNRIALELFGTRLIKALAPAPNQKKAMLLSLSLIHI